MAVVGVVVIVSAGGFVVAGALARLVLVLAEIEHLVLVLVLVL